MIGYIKSIDTTRKGFGLIAILIVIAAVVLLGGGLWYARTTHRVTPPVEKPVACSQEAKQCPDGSSVGRTGPNCQFAACPEASPSVSPVSMVDTSNWKTYRNEKYGFEVKYPTTWRYNEISNEDIHFQNLGKEYYLEGGTISPVVITVQNKKGFISSTHFAQEENKYNGTIINLKVGGQEAAQLKDYLRTETNILYAGNIYDIETPNLDDREVQGIYNVMLSTFKLTK